MPTLKPVVRKDEINQDGKANIKIRLSHGRRVRYIRTTHYIDPKYMGPDGRIVAKYEGQAKLNGALLLLQKQYNDVILDLGRDVEGMDINVVLAKLKGGDASDGSFTGYMNKRVVELRSERRFSYAESYGVTLVHLENLKKGVEIQFKDITVGFLRDFEGYLRQVKKSKVNTCRIYLNNIRAVFYHAVDRDLYRGDVSAFRKFKIRQEKSVKRSLDVADMRRLWRIRGEVTRQQRRALDVFFLIFFLMGINLKDLLYLRPDCIHKGRIYYNRFKTGRAYSIKVYPEAMELIERYRGEKYLLCLMDEKERVSAGRMHEAAHDVLSQVNKLLKTVVRVKDLGFKFTTYSARHSWATIASGAKVSRDVISHALGHGIDSMTDIYIDFDLERVDRANKLVIAKIVK